MMSLRYLKRDLRLGLLNRFCFLVFPVILSVAQALEFHRAVIGLLSFESNWGVGTIMDYYMYSVRGMRIFFFDPREYFQIPIYWFAFQIGAVYFTAYYGYNDYVNQGKMLFVLPKSRSGWWIGKWSWCCICTICYYAVGMVATGVTALLCGAQPSLHATEVLSRMYHSGVVYLNDTDILLVVILLPILTTMGFCVIQLLVSFLITPEISFALICVCLVLSAYYTAFWLPASFTMWLRTSYIDSMGLNPASGFLIGFAVIFLVLYGGRDYFQRKDVVSG